jgi:hypothetical protein
LHAILIIRHAFNELHNLDYHKITIQTISFFPTTFNGDILFELPPLFPNNPSSIQMQGMAKNYDGHTWSKVITTNNKNNFGLSFRKACCLGHLHCVKIDCDYLVYFGAWNDIAWVRESTQVSLKG